MRNDILVAANSYLSVTAREYIIKPLLDRLHENLDVWNVENECVNALAPYAAQIPATLVPDYVLALTQTYVGSIGNSYRFSRTDFYANGAALIIPKMFEAFDDTAADAFIDCIKVNTILRRRIQNPSKLNRLRSLANIVLERVSAHHSSRGLLKLLVDTTKEPEFIKLINAQK